jgi:hypothetical protein
MPTVHCLKRIRYTSSLSKYFTSISMLSSFYSLISFIRILEQNYAYVYYRFSACHISGPFDRPCNTIIYIYKYICIYMYIYKYIYQLFKPQWQSGAPPTVIFKSLHFTHTVYLCFTLFSGQTAISLHGIN